MSVEMDYSEISSSEEISKNGKWLEWFLKVWGEEVHGLSILCLLTEGSFRLGFDITVLANSFM